MCMCASSSKAQILLAQRWAITRFSAAIFCFVENMGEPVWGTIPAVKELRLRSPACIDDNYQQQQSLVMLSDYGLSITCGLFCLHRSGSTNDGFARAVKQISSISRESNALLNATMVESFQETFHSDHYYHNVMVG